MVWHVVLQTDEASKTAGDYASQVLPLKTWS